MRIIMVGPFGMQPKATMSTRALPMAKALVARGHQVTILLPPWDYPQDSGKRWMVDGVAIENIVLPPAVPLLWHVWITWRLLRRIRALDADVVHCFKPKAYAGLTALALWWLGTVRLARLRLIVDSDDWEGFGGWNEIESYSWFQKHFFAWQERWGLCHHDALTLASRALESIVWSMGVPPKQVYYVPNGINRAQVGAGSQRASTDLSQVGMGDQQTQFVHSPTVLLYTRFFEFQLGRVVRVFQQISEIKPEVRFLVVGKGLFGEQDRFLALCQAAGLGNTVEYAGWVESETLPAYFDRADVAVYPFDDTLINRCKCAAKLRDLMAAGVPVVAEAVGQNAIMITHGESGWLVRPGDAGAMVQAVLGLLDDPVLRARLGQGARQHILAHLTWERLSEQVEMAYLGER
ncbi:MAG: glycosyltransferase family 4 protein [Anaerolineae bacterium]|nr:glycosyltransferase family 4 protein [Anaerolineae bacterium]